MNTHRTTLLLVSMLLLASPAAAASAQDQAAAQAIFDSAVKLFEAGNFEQACPKFVEAQRLDPTAGTMLNVGRCYEKLGKMASAWGAYKEAEVLARTAHDADREAGAARFAEALAPLLPKLAIVIPPSVRVPGLEVTRDGTPVGEAQSGSSLPADVGHHTVEAKAPGYEPWSTTIRIDSAGSAASVEVPPLKKLAAEPGPVTSGFTWSTQRKVGMAVGGIGVAGVVVGAIFGVEASAKRNDANPNCQTNGPNMCNVLGVAFRHDELTFAHVATAGFVGGGAALVAGLVTLLTASAPKTTNEAARIEAFPLLGPRTAGLSVRAAW